VGPISIHQAADALGLSGPDRAVRAWRARETQSSFLNTADDSIQMHHVPESVTSLLRVRAGARSNPMLASIARDASDLWRAAADFRDSDVPLPHDGYLHLWAQTNPTLPYPYVLFDEAQDASPIMLRVLLRQKERLVAVGDPCQELYSFRGAINALDRIDGNDCRLTESFRFGPEVAAVANRILQARGEATPLIGRGSAGQIGTIDSDGPFTVLGRTNSALCLHALRCTEQFPTAVVGGAGDIVHLLRSVCSLFLGHLRDVTHPLLRQFHSYLELQTLAQQTQDSEFCGLVRLVDDYGAQLARVADRLENDLVPEAQAHVTLSTVHRAKGREWDQVQLLNDFRDVTNKTLDNRARNAELNVLYVAVTRARVRLQLNELLTSRFTETPVVNHGGM
jgi:hypothetical protein